MISTMDNINLSLLSRPQLVHLPLQIVDLLAQPLPQPDQPLHPGQVMHAPPRLEPYDASIDPWNEPVLTQPVTATNPEVRCPVPMHGSTCLGGAMNPGATAFYPMVPGAACSLRSGVMCEPSPEPAPGLPHFGAYPQADLTPFTLACQHQACPQEVGGAPTTVNVPIHSMYHNTIPQGHSASPGLVEDVRQMRPCGCKCELCDSICVLQRRGHTTHRCLLHKIP